MKPKLNILTFKKKMYSIVAYFVVYEHFHAQKHPEVDIIYWEISKTIKAQIPRYAL